MVDLDPAQQAVLAMLRDTDLGAVFNGGLVDDAGQDADPPLIAGTSRVQPHAIVYFGPGLLVAADLAGQVHYSSGDFAQITCVGAAPRDANWAVSQVRAALAGQRPTDVEDCGLLQETTNPGPARIDRDVNPYRWYVPLIYGLTVT